MFTGELKHLPLRTESDFLRKNKDRVSTKPHAMKSGLQGTEPQLLNPEHRHYKLLTRRFEHLCSWIEDNLGFAIALEQKTALLSKVLLVNPEKFYQYTESKQRANLKDVVALVFAATQEMVVQDLPDSQMAELVRYFNHESVHQLSMIRMGAKLKTRGHQRHYQEHATRQGLTRLVGKKRHFNTINEATTEMMSFESLKGFFKDNQMLQSDGYGLIMIFLEVLTKSLAEKSGRTATARSFRHMLYADMLSGNSDFLKLVREQYGGAFVRKLAFMDMYKQKTIYPNVVECVSFLGTAATNTFTTMLDDFFHYEPVTLMESFQIRRQSYE